MFNKFKKWFNSNRNIVCLIIFLISVILSCFNLFKGLHNFTLTIITFILLGVGYGIMIYDVRKREKNED